MSSDPQPPPKKKPGLSAGCPCNTELVGQRQGTPGAHLPASLDKSALHPVSQNPNTYKPLPLHVTCVLVLVHKHLLVPVYLWVRVEARASGGVTDSHGLVRTGQIPMGF